MIIYMIKIAQIENAINLLIFLSYGDFYSNIKLLLNNKDKTFKLKIIK